jgi:hypothetical protein
MAEIRVWALVTRLHRKEHCCLKIGFLLTHVLLRSPANQFDKMKSTVCNFTKFHIIPALRAPNLTSFRSYLRSASLCLFT